MQISVEKTGPCEADVSFTVPRADFDREYAAALNASGKNVRMKGFRAGKIPKKILEREFGEQVRQKVIEHFMNQAFSQAVQENELKPVGHERVPFDDIELGEGADLEHKISISLKPEFELKEYKGLEITDELAPVLDEEIEEAIDDLRLQRSTPEEIGADGLPEDGMAVCHILWEREGETVLDRDGVRLTSLTPLPGVDVEAFKEAMVGTKKGESFELDLTIPDDFENEALRGQAATCKVTVNEAYNMVPPAEEDLWALLEVESEEEFRQVCRDRLEMSKQQQENNRQETALIEAVIADHDFGLPEAMVTAQMEGRRQALRQQLTQSGVPEEELDGQLDEHTEENETATRKAVKALFLIGEIADQEGITVSDDELRAELQMIAARNQADFEKVVEYYRENNLFQQVQVELLERKIRSFLRENAKTTEP